MKEIIDALSIRLDQVFGDRYSIYLESVEQDLKTPCFFIQPIDSMDENMISNRKYRTVGFVIDYLPDDNSGHRSQFTEVREKLFDNLDTLELSDGVVIPTFGRNINISDDVLHFIFQCRYYVYMDKEAEPEMEELEMSVNYNG